MELQTAFYVMAIIFMSLGIGLFLGLIIMLWRIKRVIKNTPQLLQAKVSQFIESKSTQGILAVVLSAFAWFLKRRRAKKN
ncbi:hypothetical protein AUK04_01375 [Candidatus Roizmanbacteria bacterium CG2_30_33_16]|uniref:Uncharacterized protein n=3 Tax=Candidatus Roizmaniibacteriota TaxID=1752723 RepID=A0A2H0C443_9BACT|nr:hypothetical protein [Candidatus Roizmanbacteria bacterium]OIP85254.1 MAG: hypothetical protein AUK04_01375 [Candidatus Roizmanbacteria bacterium CG2_30_33_16]PIP64686.1 MAG: hypothetical protein COW96_01180 [Candidatus Roizmanbacteria bacterium CG22_combo_CG10-13_8_21_14_all_33_16]PJB88119.1 MAG: hypothetical protein CO083_03410 [Candidatus Roizmanbacteria bacterium CG_4_9_14_0_8_um_filter_34_12]